MLDLTWRVAVLGLLSFCAFKLQTHDIPRKADAVVVAKAAPNVLSPQDVARRHRELHQHLKATDDVVRRTKAANGSR